MMYESLEEFLNTNVGVYAACDYVTDYDGKRVFQATYDTDEVICVGLPVYLIELDNGFQKVEDIDTIFDILHTVNEDEE